MVFTVKVQGHIVISTFLMGLFVKLHPPLEWISGSFGTLPVKKERLKIQDAEDQLTRQQSYTSKQKNTQAHSLNTEVNIHQVGAAQE
jgi:hypothetical protein